jgi:uncharacterized protein YkwD
VARSINTFAILLTAIACASLASTGGALASPAHTATRAHHAVTRKHAKRHHRSGHASRRVLVRARCAAGSTPTASGPRAHRACRVTTPRPVPAPAQQPAATTATPCQNTELVPEAANIALVRTAVLCLINRERAAHAEQPLTVSPQLEQAAEGHAAELVADDYFAHVSPTGETPSQRIRATGYIPGPNVGFILGENLAWGTLSLSTPRAIVAAWVASPPHLENILESQYRDTGIGIAPAAPASVSGGSAGGTYAQEFGTIIR